MNNKNLAIVLAILAVAALGYAGFKMFGPGEKFQVEVKCEKCQTVEKADVCAKTQYPVNCKKCNTPTAFQAMKYKCDNANCEYGKKEVMLIPKEVGDGGKCTKCKTGGLTPQ